MPDFIRHPVFFSITAFASKPDGFRRNDNNEMYTCRANSVDGFFPKRSMRTWRYTKSMDITASQYSGTT